MHDNAIRCRYINKGTTNNTSHVSLIESSRKKTFIKEKTLLYMRAMQRSRNHNDSHILKSSSCQWSNM